MIGIRPAGLGLLPMHVFAVWIKRPQNLSKWMLVVAVALPVAVGAGSDRLIYRAVHGSVSQSTAPNLAMGISALLIKPDMKFTGPHATTLNALGAQLYTKYEPVHRYLAAAPSLAVRTQLSAAYEIEAQFYAFGDEIKEVARQEDVPVAELVIELVYPVFLVAGAVMLALSIVFLIFLSRPALMNTPEGFYLGVAAFLSAMCQGYTLFISLINEWTPRFLMAVIPQIEIVALCLILIFLHRCKLIVLQRPV
jgi:hypothetical protein